MRKQSEAGKGSKQRPGSGYADGWERIWGCKVCEECGDPLMGGECVNLDCMVPWRKAGWTEENAL